MCLHIEIKYRFNVEYSESIEHTSVHVDSIRWKFFLRSRQMNSMDCDTRTHISITNIIYCRTLHAKHFVWTTLYYKCFVYFDVVYTQMISFVSSAFFQKHSLRRYFLHSQFLEHFPLKHFNNFIQMKANFPDYSKYQRIILWTLEPWP